MSVSATYGGSSGIVESCLGRKNDRNFACWRLIGVTNVGGEVVRAWWDEGVYE
jgi:hypothetical protein